MPIHSGGMPGEKFLLARCHHQAHPFGIILKASVLANNDDLTTSCPPAYDQKDAPSYAEGSEVEVDRVVYRCNPYPFELYCTLPSFKPKSLDESVPWNDAWKEIVPCRTDENTTTIAKPTSKAPTHQPTKLQQTEKPVKSSRAPVIIPTQTPTHQPTKLQADVNPSKKQAIESAPPSRAPVIPTQPLTHQPTKLQPEAKSSKKQASKSAKSSRAPTTIPTQPEAFGESISSAPSRATIIDVQTDIQLNLQSVSSRLADEGIVVFERTCASFLESQFNSVEPHAFNDFWCKITGQRVITGKWLGEPNPRRPNNSTSLLVGVDVGGTVAADNAVRFDNLVYDIFDDQGGLFAIELRYDGWEVGLDDFENITDTSAYEEETDAETYLISKNALSNRIVLWASIGAAAAGIIIAALLSHRSRRRSRGPVVRWATNFEDEDISDEEKDYSSDFFGGRYEGFYEKGAPDNGRMRRSSKIKHKESVEQTFDEMRNDIQKQTPPVAIFCNDIANCMGDQTAPSQNQSQAFKPLPHRMVVPVPQGRNQLRPFDPLPPSSISNFRSRSDQEWSTRPIVDSPKVGYSSGSRHRQSRPERIVIAPPGKLGIIIKQSVEGCMIHNVKPNSPMKGLLFGEDLILSLNGEDISGYSAHQLTILIAKHVGEQRRFVVVSMGHDDAR